MLDKTLSRKTYRSQFFKCEKIWTRGREGTTSQPEPTGVSCSSDEQSISSDIRAKCRFRASFWKNVFKLSDFICNPGQVRFLLLVSICIGTFKSFH